MPTADDKGQRPRDHRARAGTTGLRVLRCPGCAAPVPLGQAEIVRCPYCGETSPLPPEYARLRDSERDRASHRTEAQRLFETLGHPPGPFLRFVARVPLRWIYLFTFPLVFVFLSVGLTFLLASAGRLFRVSAIDMMTNTQFFLLVAAGMFYTLGLPLALAAYGHRRTNARRNLQEALAALPPERPGGPSRCYSCGAPLDVPLSAAGVSCLYCHADNLVAVTHGWITRLEDRVRALSRTIEEAGAEDRAMRAKTRRRLLIDSVGLFVLLVPPLALLGWAEDNDNNGKHWPPRWQEFVRQEPRLLIHQPKPKDRYGYAWSAHDLMHVNGRRSRMLFDNAECTTNKDGLFCKRSYLVALRRGETLMLESEALPPGVTTLVVTVGHRRNGLFDEDWTPDIKNAPFAPGQPVRFAAPLSAWYKVDFLSVEEGSRPPAAFRLSARAGK